MTTTGTLQIKQGTTRTVTVTGLLDATGVLLDPTGWDIHAVARPGIWAAPVAVWRDTPGPGELLAEVMAADLTITPTAQPDEKWIYLHIDPTTSLAWTWFTAVVDITITEPVTNRKETFSTTLRLTPTTVRP